MTIVIIALLIIVWLLIIFIKDKKVAYIVWGLVTLFACIMVWWFQLWYDEQVYYLENSDVKLYNCVKDLQITDVQWSSQCLYNHLKSYEFYVENIAP